jgi:hypothetical protein
MNDFTNPKSMKKLFLLGACGGTIVGISYYTKKLYLSLLGSYMVGVLIRKGYELGQQDTLEKVTNDLNDIRTNLSEIIKTEETE